MKVYDSVENLIGNTPIVRLKNVEKFYNLNCKLYAKLEFFNPAGSIKDRVAKQMLNDYEEQGVLKKDTVIIEPTSGNTGIGLSLIGALRGYKTIIVMPENMSEERKKIIKAYGAELVLSKKEDGMKGAISLANEIKNSYPSSIIVGQFDNPSNTKAHYLTTGPEIFKDLDGDIDVFVSGIGTGGTITGTGKYLKEQSKDILVVGVEPLSSPLLTKGYFGQHKIQGIGANFIPSIFDKNIVDKIVAVSCEDAFETVRQISKNEGLLVGISAGANLFGAIEFIKNNDLKNKSVAVIFPDSGERYLSTENLFERL